MHGGNKKTSVRFFDYYFPDSEVFFHHFKIMNCIWEGLRLSEVRVLDEEIIADF